MTTAEPVCDTSNGDAQCLITKAHKCTHTGCTRTYRSAAKLREHVHSHTGARPHACPHDGCTQSYRRRAHLARHVASVHDRVFAHVCTVCDKRYAHADHLRRHRLAAHERALPCGECDAVFGRRVDLRRHILAAHGAPVHADSGRRTHTCECGATHATWSEHVAHRRAACAPHAARRLARAARRRARRHACGQCGREYATAYGAREHERLAHGTPGERRCHVCVHCAASFCHRRSLARHVERLHAPLDGTTVHPTDAVKSNSDSAPLLPSPDINVEDSV